jgi:osmotically inducible protein OsmC
MTTSTSSAVWEGGLRNGHGRFNAGSGAFGGDYSFATRFESAKGTNPEELLAAAHAACFAMAFSADLGRAGYTPEELHVEAEVTFDKPEGGGWTVTASALTVLGHVHGITPEEFDRIAEGTRDGCPISRALAGNVALSVDATLETDG